MSTDVHTLSGAYALNALAPEEAAEFRRHLAGCPACREEVRELRNAVARMGAAEAATPPPDLRSRILAAADRTPQDPPAGAPSMAAVPSSVVPPVAGAPLEAAGEPSADHDRGRKPWVTWLAAAAAALVIAGGGAFGVQAMLDDDRLNEGVVRVFEAPDAHTATVETEEGGELRVAVSASRKEMAVDARGLPPLDENHVYQLWSVQGEQIYSAAILTDPEAGAAMGMPDEDTQVALTIEPAGGSEQPTSEPIVQVDPYAVLRS